MQLELIIAPLTHGDSCGTVAMDELLPIGTKLTFMGEKPIYLTITGYDACMRVTRGGKWTVSERSIITRVDKGQKSETICEFFGI